LKWVHDHAFTKVAHAEKNIDRLQQIIGYLDAGINFLVETYFPAGA